MTDDKKPSRPRTFKTALAAWADQMQTVRDTPTSETLDSLCTLLDVMDRELVQHWKQPGHGEDGKRLAQALIEESAK